MNKRKIFFVISTLILLLGGSYFLSRMFVSMKAEPSKKPDINLKRHVKAEEVLYSTIISSVREKGRVISGQQVALVAEASGKLEKGNVNIFKGTSFRKGQLLGVIYKDEVELALKARKSQFLASLVNVLADLKVDFPEYYDSYKSFFNAIDISDKMPELPVIKDERLKVYLANKDLLSEYFGILQDEKKMERHYLFAPFRGTFSSVDYQVGSYVNSGSRIAQMIRTDHLEIEVPVNNRQSAWIQIGQKVKVFTGEKDSVLTGVVIRKSDFIEESTQSRSVYVQVDNVSNEIILAGEYKVVEFVGKEVPSSMKIPRNAVFNSNVVFIVENGKLKKRQINILKWNENSLLFNGLEEGAMVVTEPLINIKENCEVMVLGK